MFESDFNNLFSQDIFDVKTNFSKIQELGKRLDQRIKRLEDLNRKKI
jgi:hypothetical protein